MLMDGKAPRSTQRRKVSAIVLRSFHPSVGRKIGVIDFDVLVWGLRAPGLTRQSMVCYRYCTRVRLCDQVFETFCENCSVTCWKKLSKIETRRENTRKSGFPNSSDTNRAVQTREKARSLEFRIKEVEGLTYS